MTIVTILAFSTSIMGLILITLSTGEKEWRYASMCWLVIASILSIPVSLMQLFS